MQRGLHFSVADLQWVVNGYTLIFGGFLLLGGRAADLLGRKRLFVAGVILFSAASLLNGVAQSSGMLIFGRGVQGLGGALVSPAALSIVTTTFSDGEQRTKALGVWSAIAAGGAAIGLLLGGVLTDIANWRLGLLRQRPGGDRHRGAGLVVLVYAIVKAQAAGWGSTPTLSLGAVALALLAAFLVIENRSQAPLMRLSIFRIRTLAVADTALLLVASAMFGMFFFASLYVQEILGYSPLRAGLAFLPVSAGIMVGAGLAQQLIKRLGVRQVTITRITLATAGMLVLTQLPVHGSYAGDLLVGLLPMSIGMGLTFVPITLLGTSGVKGEDASLASGLFNTAQQVGGSLGLAILASLAASETSRVLHGAAGAGQLAARVSGYHVAFLAAAIMLAAGAVLMTFALRKSHTREIERELAAGPVAAVPV